MLEQGIFPKALKLTRVCPIFKKGDKSNPSSYRPISHHLNKEDILHDQVYDTSYTIVEKIQNLENSDEVDLNLSLTLAAEAGNALLQENLQLKAEMAQLLEKCTRLEAKLADTTEELEEVDQIKEKCQSKVENLHQELANLQNQLDREKQNQTQLHQFFEEHDINQRKIIDSYEIKIANLANTIKLLSTKLESMTNNTEIHQVPHRDVDTQTSPPTRDVSLPLAITCKPTDYQPSNHSLIQDMTYLKARQDQVENSIKILQNQLQNHADGLQPRPAKHIPSNKNKITTPNNHFSVSLQVAKNKVCKQNKKAAHIPVVSPHHIEPTETTPVSSAENVRKMSKNPPLNSKQRAKDETCEESTIPHLSRTDTSNNVLYHK
ncbi:hypothetical protein J6590_055103 [Homalodisca vitripennis]|nr:hypothetical protein J6590_055103 [Homalodisca vitripennis]